ESTSHRSRRRLPVPRLTLRAASGRIFFWPKAFLHSQIKITIVSGPLWRGRRLFSADLAMSDRCSARVQYALGSAARDFMLNWSLAARFELLSRIPCGAQYRAPQRGAPWRIDVPTPSLLLNFPLAVTACDSLRIDTARM